VSAQSSEPPAETAATERDPVKYTVANREVQASWFIVGRIRGPYWIFVLQWFCAETQWNDQIIVL
jgi:hypothetical protein